MGANVHPESTGTAVPSRIVAITARNCDDSMLSRCWDPRDDPRDDAAPGRIDRVAGAAGVRGVRVRPGAGGRAAVRGVRARDAVVAERVPAVRAAEAPCAWVPGGPRGVP